MKFKFSCVVDNKPLFQAQAYILINSLTKKLKIHPNDIFVHVPKNTDKSFLNFCEQAQVNVIKFTPFDLRNAYCNKLVQIDTFNALDDFDYVFFMDCDLAIVSLDNLTLNDDVYAKIVDFPNPPLAILKRIFEAAEITNFRESKTNFEINGNNLSEWNNCNGGLYIISKRFLSELGPKWKEYAKWCIDSAKLFTDKYSKHADQVGFALAMNALNKDVVHLDIKWNFPCHVNPNLLSDITPKILHYHDRIDHHMHIKKTGLPKVDEQIKVVNELISERNASTLDNSLFWNLRYSLYPELGSGVGSRGEILDFKKRIIKYATYFAKESTITDVGCGDIELTRDFSFQNYTGLDVSNEALKLGKEKRPDWNFENKSITSDEISESDIIFCFDVLIHQSKKSDFQEIVKSIVKKGNRRIIVGAYNKKPEYESEITYFYGGILEEIKKYEKYNEIAIVGEYRDVTVVVASVHNSDHQRDIPSENLNIAFQEVDRPDILQYLVDVSRTELGFFTSHYTRVFEYSWLFSELENVERSSIIDLGAGVCPLPICLYHQGHKVTTIDSHSLIRRQSEKKGWNEWGFLDYSIFGDIKSQNVDFSQFTSLRKYDYIYSISVIEHVSAVTRNKILKKAARLLKKDGILLLTIDLIPNTDNLWNFSEDQEVESTEIHGNIKSFKSELEKYGFHVLEEQIKRNIMGSRTDVYFVKSVLKSQSFFTKYLKS
ncbi:methyltransferase domain-containing protein [Constantimarinum furrinae]|uniref:Uncharacterized protein n=1 Tax=Constantimarinum furrinae TaxID=2562285 RepID=A0A7G8PQV0_9FLAO|nr:class I SAM-dependent methyltransferase [Constantimarinum furrinae]QNJ96716.1 hypothetical protein ALE3EI_0125 [Constantimarinum furrinae]